MSAYSRELSKPLQTHATSCAAAQQQEPVAQCYKVTLALTILKATAKQSH